MTAAANPAEATEMLSEMATTGVTMAVVVTAFWGVMTYASYKIMKREEKSAVEVKVEE